MKHPIAQTRNGLAVYVDLVRSPAAIHISRQPSLLGLVKEVVAALSPAAPQVRLEQDLGRTIGYGAIVETTDQDTVLYAQPLRDEVYMRFVKKGKSLATQHLTVVLQRDTEGSYELRDVWLGRLHPPRPGSSDEVAASKTFWSNHAFVLDDLPVQSRTITKVCPY